MIGEMTANCTKNQMTAIFPDDGVVVTCRRVFLQNFNPLPISRKKNPSKKFIKITPLISRKIVKKIPSKLLPLISRKISENSSKLHLQFLENMSKKSVKITPFISRKNIGYIEARVQFLPKKSRISYRKIHSGKLFLRSG